MTPNRWRPLEFKLDSDLLPLPANGERGGGRMKGPAAPAARLQPRGVALGTHGCPGPLGFQLLPEEQSPLGVGVCPVVRRGVVSSVNGVSC